MKQKKYGEGPREVPDGVGRVVPWSNATPAPAPCSVVIGQPYGTGVLLHLPIAEVLLCVPISGLVLSQHWYCPAVSSGHSPYLTPGDTETLTR